MSYRVPVETETERLILRPFQESDLQDLHLYFSDPIATKYTVAKPYSLLETWRVLCLMLGHWQAKGYGPYAMFDKKSKRVLGIAGFWFPYDWPEAEIKWALTRTFWGQGYATEAVKEIQRIAIEYMPDMSLISFIHSENKRSIDLALRVGSKFEKETTFRNGLWHIYRHPS